MFEKLAQIEKSYDELTEQISQPEFMSDMSVYAKLMKQHRSLGEVVEKYREVRRMQEELAGAKEMADAADDEEMRELALAEASEIEAKLPTAEEELKVLLLPRDPNDEKNVTKQPSSLRKCFECTLATPSGRVGRWRSWTPRTQASAVSRKRLR